MRAKTIKKINAFIIDCQTRYGKDTTVSYQDLKTVWESNKEKYPHVVFFIKNTNFKVGYDKYIITKTLDVPQPSEKSYKNDIQELLKYIS
jgi:hypothetical protein